MVPETPQRITNPHDKTKSTNLRSWIHLDSQPFLGGSVMVNMRSENERFGPTVRARGRTGVNQTLVILVGLFSWCELLSSSLLLSSLELSDTQSL